MAVGSAQQRLQWVWVWDAGVGVGRGIGRLCVLAERARAPCLCKMSEPRAGSEAHRAAVRSRIGCGQLCAFVSPLASLASIGEAALCCWVRTGRLPSSGCLYMARWVMNQDDVSSEIHNALCAACSSAPCTRCQHQLALWRRHQGWAGAG
jgi:hypothetical protein